MAKEGWIKLHRRLQECWVWDDKPFSKGQAWVDLLLSANHADKKILFNGELITITRGQYMTSVRKLAEKWGWSRNTVLKFLTILESDKMLTRDSDNHRTLLTIENYGVYQSHEDTEKPQGEPHLEPHNEPHPIPQGEPHLEHKQECKECKECKDINLCSEPKKPSEPSVIEIPLNDKSLYPIYQSNVDEWKELYPNVDVMQELRKMKGWCLSNPTKRKTKRGISKFINSWLSREQDKPSRAREEVKENYDGVSVQLWE